jgi:magnesium chelatase family protein
MMARRVPGILPPLTLEEALDVTAVHSVAGLLKNGDSLVVDRPFRAPHHTISDVALVGGGQNPRPGEISLAHHGVLFLDEMLEFSRHVLEVLRQPLEDGSVMVARAARTAVFPARFVLVGAMNPCPCGFATDPARECRCTPQQVARYRGRLSGPLRDRLDLTVDVPALPPSVLGTEATRAESSEDVRRRVIGARERQRVRYASDGVRTNAELSPSLMARYCGTDAQGRRLLDAAVTRMTLSARAYDRIHKVARTIADLTGVERIGADQIAEALQFRML